MDNLKSRLTPARFQAILVAAMVLLAAIGAFGFYAAHKQLSTYAEEVSVEVAEAEVSESDVQRLRQVESELERLADVRTRAKSISAESQSYQYQNQIINDLNRYSEQAGITISQYSFQDADSSSSSNSSSAAAEDAPAAASGGLNSTTVNISLSSPVQYTNLLQFMRSIEQNLTKMQIAGVSLAPGDGADSVSTDSLSIEVYVK